MRFSKFSFLLFSSFSALSFSLVLGLAAAPVFAGGKKESVPSTAMPAVVMPEVVVWTYDSFTSEWGPGPEVAKRFLAETGVNVRWVAHGDAGVVLSRLLLEGEAAGADIILGLDQNIAGRALDSGLLEAYKPAGADKIDASLLNSSPGIGDFRLTPFDYSYFAIIYDSQALPQPPQSLEDLTKSAYAKKLILMDPRGSSPGMGFLVWTIAAYGDRWSDYWRRLQPSILTIAEGWSTGYGLFTEGEAPLVLSYTTSPGYHLEYEGTDRYRAAIFADGHPLQVELAGLLKSAPNKAAAKRFLDFMLSDSFQDVIPLTNWMYPVTGIALPASYRINPKPATVAPTSPVSDTTLNQWARLFE
jgi:thiamine transport system substrate-binding protein